MNHLALFACAWWMWNHPVYEWGGQDLHARMVDAELDKQSSKWLRESYMLEGQQPPVPTNQKPHVTCGTLDSHDGPFCLS